MKKLKDFISCTINDQHELKLSGGLYPSLYITVLGTTDSGPGEDRSREDDEISIGFDWR